MSSADKAKIDQMVYQPSFVRKVDKSRIRTCSILGSEILVGSMKWLLRYITVNIKKLSGDYIMVSATKELLLAYDDPRFFRCQNGGVLAIPDGGPLRTYGRLHGYKKMERITGPDLMLEVFRLSEKHGWRHYFYGSTRETQDLMRKRLNREFPELRIAGMRPSVFRDLTEEEDRQLVQEINDTHPDFVWFCLGVPKSCYFAAEHQGILEGLMISVGAAFDYYAGNIKRAPEWMQRMDLEWLYRVIQEPGRLAKRYLTTIPRFLWLAYIGGRR